MPRPRQRGERGNGSIYFRADRGRWQFAITLEDAEGHRTPHTWSFRTEAEARRKQREILRDRDQGVGQPNERQTVRQFFERYETTVLSGRAANTRRNNHTAIYQHILPAFGDLPLSRLQPATIQRYYAQMLQDAYAPSTVRLVHGVLRAGLNQAVAWGELVRNPTTGAKPPKVPATEPRILQPEQIQHLLKLLEGNRLEALLWLAVTTGMRLAELLGLHWADVHLTRGTVTIHQQHVRGEGIKQLKTGVVGGRTIPLTAPARAALERHQAKGVNGPLVFHTRTGRPLSQAWLLTEWWRPLLARAGYRAKDGPTVYTPHSLRHACGSFLLWLGMDIAQVSRILGHSSVATTARIYSHAQERGEREAMERLGRLLTPPEPAPDPTSAD